ncbi:MAG: hypothetical protein GY804_09105 [Alphaproteobacteria bacterium]|nr:hypothetical protein [Alphaproteobacteria bacterium]
MSAKTFSDLLPKFHKEFPLLSNTKADCRLLGTTVCSIAAEHNTSQRLVMAGGQTKQYMEIFGNERPRVFHGFEKQIMKRKFYTTAVDEEYVIKAVIPRIHTVSKEGSIRTNPSTTVIYINNKNEAGYFNINGINEYSDGFGCINRKINSHLLTQHKKIPAGTEFVKGPGKGYMGINTKVAFMEFKYVPEDSVLIAQSYADKCATTGISKAYIRLKINQRPKNIYGDEEEYKFIPDIGECVGADGILAAIATHKQQTLLSEIGAANKGIDHLHDHPLKVRPGAKIENIEIACDQKILKNKAPHIQQIKKYIHQDKRYWNDIIDVYSDLKETRTTLSPELHVLINRALSFVPQTKKSPTLTDHGHPIDFVNIVITFSYHQPIERGFKMSGLEGGKGVVSAVLPDNEMPKDKDGNPMDMVLAMNPMTNRMNYGQGYEMDLSHVGEVVENNIRENKVSSPYEYIMGFLEKVNENYAKLLRGMYDDKKNAFVQQCLDEGIHIFYPPFLKNGTGELLVSLQDEYEAYDQYLYFDVKSRKGNYRSVKTYKPIATGWKYVLWLCKVPHSNASGVGRVSHFNVPIRPQTTDRTNNHRDPIRKTLIKLSEDDGRNISMMTGDSEAFARTLGLYGAAPYAVHMLCDHLLTAPQPTNINKIPISTEEIMHRNVYLNILSTQLGCLGVSIQPSKCEDLDEDIEHIK